MYYPGDSFFCGNTLVKIRGAATFDNRKWSLPIFYGRMQKWAPLLDVPAVIPENPKKCLFTPVTPEEIGDELAFRFIDLKESTVLPKVYAQWVEREIPVYNQRVVTFPTKKVLVIVTFGVEVIYITDEREITFLGFEPNQDGLNLQNCIKSGDMRKLEAMLSKPLNIGRALIPTNTDEDDLAILIRSITKNMFPAETSKLVL